VMPREAYLAVLGGEEPDRFPILASPMLRQWPQGGWLRRLLPRGLGQCQIVPPYYPFYWHPRIINPYLPDVTYKQEHYRDGSTTKCRHSFETPLGSVTCVTIQNPLDEFGTGLTQEYFVKQPSDWRIMNYLFDKMIPILSPFYAMFQVVQDEFGDTGVVEAAIEKTPFQRAWIEMASLERTYRDFKETPEELQEFVETQKRFHERIAEIAVGCPAKVVKIMDNITETISPKYYEMYCMPAYETYRRALEGSGKILGVHMDGRLAHLKQLIGASPLGLIDSFTVPPTGNVSLSEAKEAWPGKILFINLPPHLAWSEPSQIRDGYAKIVDEWGSKRLVFEHTEDMPPERLEIHLAAALDALGY
jgi:hypothetical protein